jgi:predicted small lipoprotein YifL
MRRISLSLVALLALAVAAAGCGKKASDTAAEEAIETSMRASGQEADVSVTGDTMQIKSADGDMSFGEGTALPDGWPEDVPVYKGMKLLSSMKSKEGSMIQGSTADSHEKVVAFYKEQVAKQGWSEDSVLTQPQMAMMNYTKEKRRLALVIGGAESETSVSVSITNE